MSLAAWAAVAAMSICFVLPSVSSNGCMGPQSVGVISPWNGKASLEFSTMFCRCRILPLTASTMTV